MQPEDRLDALLSLRNEDTRRQSKPTFVPSSSDDEDLGPMLDAADRLADLGNAEPSADFTNHLETMFFARAAYLRQQTGAYMPLGSDEPTLPGLAWDAGDYETTEIDRSRARRLSPARSRQPVWRRLIWPALAATLLLAIGLTTLTAAAAAGPGTLLYGLRRWEQNLQVSIAGSAADRTKLHLHYAQDALDALSATIASHQAGSTYDDALSAFTDESRAATSNLSSVPSGAERDTLSAQLEQLLAQARTELHNALASLPWAQRLTTTDTLAEIGDNVVRVTHVTMVYSRQGLHIWTITVTGAGFQQGATLLVNGQPAGTVISVSPTTVVAQLSGDDSATTPGSIGIANPDDTAAQTTSVEDRESGEDATPGAQQTPVDDHGGSGSGDSGGNGADSTPTPSPSPESTP